MNDDNDDDTPVSAVFIGDMAAGCVLGGAIWFIAGTLIFVALYFFACGYTGD